ncbi:hypothetical protein [Rhodococcus rhodnii]|uniref:Integral membrane protein n=1 Tax=Rhodococcus rhodnii LMG 5362 TaxID=1273125 RepID=R7WRB2_9NOCA|nr:hypothetical protein Rrhod_0750 [Rhodococcus rhodnii LMG 5362]
MIDKGTDGDTGKGTGKGRALFYTAVTLFAVGVAAIVAIFVVGAMSDSSPGLPLYVVSLACPLGFLLAIVYALRSGRRSR